MDAVAGTSELALRLPSALCGIALVPVAYGIGRRLGEQRAAVALAALVAVHPLLVYYSQEARGYAAVALACAVGFLYFLDAARGAARRARVGAGLGGRARLPLLRDLPGRDRGGDPARPPRPRGAARARRASRVAGAALLPLVLEQLDGEHGDNVTAGRGPRRAREGRRRRAGSWASAARRSTNLEWLAGVLMLAGVALLLVRRGARDGAPPGRRRRRRRGADAARGARRRRLPQQPQHAPGAGHPARDPGARLRRRAAPAPRSARPRARCWRPPPSAPSPIPRTRARTGATPRAPSAAARRSSIVPPQRDVAVALVRARACEPRRRRERPRARRRPHRPRARPAAAGRARRPARPRLQPRRAPRTRDRILIARYRAAAPQPVTPRGGRRVGARPGSTRSAARAERSC